MCGCGCIGLVMKATPVHLQAVGAKHPEAKQEKIKKSQHFPFKKEYKTMTFEVCGAGISKSAKTTKNHQKQQKKQKKSKPL